MSHVTREQALSCSLCGQSLPSDRSVLAHYGRPAHPECLMQQLVRQVASAQARSKAMRDQAAEVRTRSADIVVQAGQIRAEARRERQVTSALVR
jgi:hypothetical protein